MLRLNGSSRLLLVLSLLATARVVAAQSPRANDSPVAASEVRRALRERYPSMPHVGRDSAITVWLLADSAGRVHASSLVLDTRARVDSLGDAPGAPSLWRSRLFKQFDATKPATDFIETLRVPAARDTVVVRWVQVVGNVIRR